MTQALTTINPERRTVIMYPVNGDPWPVIAQWAQQHGFNPREPQTGNVKLFQKGSGFWTAATRTQFTYDGAGTMQVQAWIPISIFTRIAALFMLPSEMHIRSGGFRAVIPRNTARKAVNDLLARVGAPPVP